MLHNGTILTAKPLFKKTIWLLMACVAKQKILLEEKQVITPKLAVHNKTRKLICIDFMFILKAKI